MSVIKLERKKSKKNNNKNMNDIDIILRYALSY